MKKPLWLVGAALIAGAFTACDNTPENPGDFSLRSELTLGERFVSLSHPERSYELEVAGTRDTVYKYPYQIMDTLFEYSADGKDSTYVYGPDGKVIVNVIDTFNLSTKTATLIEYKPITIESMSDTITVNIYSNSVWRAKLPEHNPKFLSNWNSTEMGFGDGVFGLASSRNRKKTIGPALQTIITQDSMVCVLIPIYQAGERD